MQVFYEPELNEIIDIRAKVRSNHLRKFFLLGMLLCTTMAYPQDQRTSFNQFNLNLEFGKYVKFGAYLELERNPQNWTRFTWLAGLGYSNDGSDIVEVYGTFNYYLPRKSRELSFFYIGIGPTYLRREYKDSFVTSGLGVRVTLGFKYLFLEKLLIGANVAFINYYDPNHPTQPHRTDGTGYNLSLSYRFIKK